MSTHNHFACLFVCFFTISQSLWLADVKRVNTNFLIAELYTGSKKKFSSVAVHAQHIPDTGLFAIVWIDLYST